MPATSRGIDVGKLHHTTCFSNKYVLRLYVVRDETHDGTSPELTLRDALFLTRWLLSTSLGCIDTSSTHRSSKQSLVCRTYHIQPSCHMVANTSIAAEPVFTSSSSKYRSRLTTPLRGALVALARSVSVRAIGVVVGWKKRGSLAGCK